MEKLSHLANSISPALGNTYRKACSEKVNPHPAESVDRGRERYIP
jgi:hypothetical protein